MSNARNLSKLLGTDTQITTADIADGVFQANKNLIINGAMQVAQRGISFSSNNSIDYTVDRWAIFSNGVSTTTQESFTAGQTDVPNEPVKYLKWNISTYASGDNLFQRVEDVRTGAGQTVTLSFYAKADSSITNRPRLIQNFGSGGSSEVVTVTSTNALTASWQKFTITATLPSISGKTIGSSSYLELEALRFTDTFTGGVYITNVQLEVGSTATPFEHRSFGDELLRCQRYYEKSYAYSVAPGTAVSYPSNIAITVRGMDEETNGQRYITNTMRVEKRANPTNTFYDDAGNSGRVTTFNNAGTGTNNVGIGLVLNQPSMIGCGPANSAIWGFAFFYESDAEL